MISVEVNEAALGAGVLFDRGGNGTILRVPYRLPGVSHPLVFKKYKTEVVQSAGLALRSSLASLIRWRERLSPRDRAHLDRRVTWPLAVVVRGGDAVGVLMRELPDEYWVTLSVLGEKSTEVFHLDRLYSSASKRARVGIPSIDEAQSRRLAARIASAVRFLHDRGMILGDISGHNIVVRRDPSGEYYPMLIDADAYRRTGTGSPVPQGNSPSWFAPETLIADREYVRLSTSGADPNSIDAARARAVVLTQRSDVYKIALLTVRLFHDGSESAVVTRPDGAWAPLVRQLGATRAARVVHGLHPDALRRPQIGVLSDALALR